MKSHRSDDTSSEILVTFSSGNQYLASRVEQALAPTDYPVLTRREKWGFNSDQYLVVIRLCDQTKQDGNVLMYDVKEIREAVEQKPEVRHRNLTDRERAKYVGRAVSNKVMENLQSLL